MITNRFITYQINLKPCVYRIHIIYINKIIIIHLSSNLFRRLTFLRYSTIIIKDFFFLGNTIFYWTCVFDIIERYYIYKLYIIIFIYLYIMYLK